MRAVIALALPALAAAMVPRNANPTACNADNCLRAVRATQFPTRAQDCATVLAVTVTPATSTVYTTTTVSATSSVTQTTTLSPFRKRAGLPDSDVHNLAKRAPADTQPTQAAVLRERDVVIPTYASACSGLARYSSACSCVGQSPMTVTAPTPVTTVVVTASVTTTTTATVTETPAPFNCKNVAARAGTFEANFNRPWTYEQVGDLPYSSDGLDSCCEMCVARGNCLVFGIRVSSGGPNGRACEMYLGLDGGNLDNKGAVCPYGAAKGEVFGFQHSLDHIAQGPCFIMPPANEFH